MLRRHPASVALPACLLIVLAGCSSAISGQGAPAGSGASTGAPKSMPGDAAGLAALMQRGVAGITSAHLTLDVTAAGQNVNGAGDETLTNGTLASLDLSETISQVGTLRLRIVGAQSYASLPANLNHSDKPWILISANSTDPLIKSLDASLSSSREAASLTTPSSFVSAAKSVKLVGPDPVDGAAATHYSIVVDVAKLPAGNAGRRALIAAGLTTLPIDLWVDGQGRPVKVSEKVAVQGQSVSSLVTLGKFYAPVHITAPPAGQVSTS